MWYSVELLETGEIYVQTTRSLFLHGAKGMVLLHCTYQIAVNIQNENQ